MSSFERPVPTVLSTGKIRLIEDDVSYLDQVKAWEDYNCQETRMREQVSQALENFSAANGMQIDDKLLPGSAAHTLATLTMTTSVSICEDIFKFWTNFVRTLTKSKFSHQKAHHVTTCLVKRIYTEIFVPRQGVITTFKAGNMDQIMAAILWSILLSLQSVQEMKIVGFTNLGIVTSKLTKFLL